MKSPRPPEPGMIYVRHPLEMLTRDDLADEVRRAARDGYSVVVNQDGIWWRPNPKPDEGHES